MFTEPTTQWEFAKNTISLFTSISLPMQARFAFTCLQSGEIGRDSYSRINSQDLADFVNAEFADIKE